MFVDHFVGRYRVGATTFRFPVSPARRFGSSELNANGLNGVSGPAVSSSEIAFTLYYPTVEDLSGEKLGVDWLLKPVQAALVGTAYYWDVPQWKLLPLFYLHKARLKIPVYTNAPLLPPQDGSATWPLVVFSHGMAQTRNSYSHICSRIASSGKVVIIMEHRDGSSVVCFPRSPETGLSSPKYYIRPTDTTYGEARQFELRMDQLAMRSFEIYQAYNTLKELVNGNRGALSTLDDSSIDWSFLAGKVNFERVQLVGHSFGGATTCFLLSNPPPAGCEPLPVTHALLLDPWIQPFPSSSPAPCATYRNVKMAIINSEQYTLWRTHFERLQRVAKSWNDTPIYTILQSTHMHFCDSPAAQSGSTALANKVIRIIGNLSMAFLDERMDLCLSEHTTRQMVFERAKATPFSKAKGRLAGNFGDIVVHGLPTGNERALRARL